MASGRRAYTLAPNLRALSRDELADMARAELERRKRVMEQKEAAEEDLLAFIRMFWRSVEPETPLIEGWPLEALCDFMMAVTDGHITRGLINVSPGFMKSLTLNVFWPAWEWGPCGRPWLRYISSSYSASLTERDNIRFARIINDPVYRKCWGDQFTVVREGQELVENSRTGWKRATSVGGSTTGHRGDRVLIDDANDPQTVESEAVRGTTNLWLREVMPDRLNNLEDGVIINLQQRTHEEDATGTLAKYGEGYTWLAIPMEFDPLRAFPVVLRRDEDGNPTDTWVDPRSIDENGDELEGIEVDDKGRPHVRMGSAMARAEGTLAWPARFPPDEVRKLKALKGPVAWAGQYQQSPTPRGGGIIRRDWWLTWTDKQFPDFGTVVASLDTAQEENTEADYNALTVWGAFPGVNGEPKVCLVAAWQDRLPLSQLVARVAELCGQHKADYLLIEHKTRGRDVHDEIRRIYATAPWQTILVKPLGDKVSRLSAVSGLFSGDVRKDPVTGMDAWGPGMVYAPDTQWAEDVINEVANFPRVPHDDITDSVSQALGWMRRNGVVLRKVEHDAVELEKKRYRKPIGVPYAIRREP